MAQLGLYRKVVLDSTGAPVSGASVEVRRQGATVNGDQGSVTTITVNDPGRIIAGDTVNYNADAGTNRSVGSVTETTVVLGGLSIAASLSDDDRITVVTALPTLYNDAQGVETKSNPLTTDSNGAVYCYLPGGKYDVKVSGSGITTQLLADESVEGAEHIVSSLHPSATGTASAFIFDTARSLSAGDNVISVRHTGSEVAYIRKSGNFMATGSATVGGSGTFGGAVMLSSTLTVSSGASISGRVYVGGTFEATSSANVQGAATFNSVVTVNTNTTISGFLSAPRFMFGQTTVLAAGATQMNADSASYFTTANTAVTTISAITNGKPGQLVVVHVNDTFTYFDDGSVLGLGGSSDFHSSTKGTVLGFIVITPGAFNYEIFRSVK